MIARAGAQRWRRWGGPCVAILAASLWPLRHAGTALVTVRDIAQPDAIVSLASHEWERLPEAAALARRAPQARILLTEPMSVNEFNCHDCANRINRLVAAGIDRGRIEVLPRRVYRTLDEAEAVRQWALTERPRSVVVVTSPYHTARALACFRSVLSETGIAVGVHPASGSPARPGRWWARKYDRWYVVYEWRARVFYLMRFGIW
jgi:uncharacterized SAM-binding protein YcdF (DUF218 family)